MRSHPNTPLDARRLPADDVFAPSYHPPLLVRIGRWIFLLLVFLCGILLGSASVLFYIANTHDTPATGSTGSTGSSAIVIQLNSTLISQILEPKVKSAGLPGDIEHVQVRLAHEAPIMVTGDDTLSLFGFSFTKQFTLSVQPNVQACRLHVSVVHADLAGIPATAFVKLYEDQINQALQNNPSSLPHGFIYCMTGVRTETNGLFAYYSATPIPAKS